MFIKAGNVDLWFVFCTQDREVCACWIIPMCFCISQVCHEGLQPASLPQPPTTKTPKFRSTCDIVANAQATLWQKSWCWPNLYEKWVTCSQSNLHNWQVIKVFFSNWDIGVYSSASFYGNIPSELWSCCLVLAFCVLVWLFFFLRAWSQFHEKATVKAWWCWVQCHWLLSKCETLRHLWLHSVSPQLSIHASNHIAQMQGCTEHTSPECVLLSESFKRRTKHHIPLLCRKYDLICK